ncbi:hypothetical protein BBJ28_00017187 [Nothophytophthora sp. Chile5]|nr:hypothetical protein BBJ28_00017187 [Nothophytophthora sp. Chile5]
MAGGSLFQVGEDIEFWRVLVHLSILVLGLVLFESALHQLERQIPRSDKYQHMLRKAYRELMVLGLLSLGLKVIKEIPDVDSDSKTMLAFQVADLTIFILALALILQAVCVFLLLRKYNEQADRSELITTQDLAKTISALDSTGTDVLPQTETPSRQRSCFSDWFCRRQSAKARAEKQLVEWRLLRLLFLRRFALPQLFPFSKYLRRAQANQISHMIEVEPSMWLLLLAVAWAICGLVDILQELDADLSERYELVEVFVVFAWTLVLLHVLVLLYFRSCVRQLLNAAGYSDDQQMLAANLRAIGEEEVGAWRNETADNALDTMNKVQEQLEEIEDRRNAQRNALLKKDTGLQLIATCLRNLKQLGLTKVNIESTSRRPSGAHAGSPEIRIRFFSRKAWHVAVMFLLILNGFFIALLVQCAVYDLDDIYGDFGVIPAVLVPLPLAVNALVLQQCIFRYFIIVCSILRVDANTLGEVVSHFSETVELRAEFGTSLLQCLLERQFTPIDLQAELQAQDLSDSGLLTVDKLRVVLAKFGFRLSRFRFNSVVKLLFELKNTRVEFAQVLRLVALAQQERPSDNEASISHFRPRQLLRRSVLSYDEGGHSSLRSTCNSISASTRHLPLLAQSSLGSEPSPSDFVHVSMSTPGLAASSSNSISNRPSISTTSEAHSNVQDGGSHQIVMLERSCTYQFSGSSSRALHDMFNIRGASESHVTATSSNVGTTRL